MDTSLFKKYKEFKPTYTGKLFGINLLDAIRYKICPYCYNKLYLMRNNKFYYCKSKKHKNKFIISRQKVDK